MREIEVFVYSTKVQNVYCNKQVSSVKNQLIDSVNGEESLA